MSPILTILLVVIFHFLSGLLAIYLAGLIDRFDTAYDPGPDAYKLSTMFCFGYFTLFTILIVGISVSSPALLAKITPNKIALLKLYQFGRGQK